MSLIPGASAIGRGFNILGTYDAKSLTWQVINLGPVSSTWEFKPTGSTYEVPENARPVEWTHTTGTSYVYNTVEQFQSHFSQKAGVKASYGGFSGQFDLAYNKTVNTDRSYYYGGFEAEYTAWELAVQNASQSWLTPEFRDDPDVKNLPSTYTPENQEQFFAVFRKWGTHLVTHVVVGGSLDYYEAVQTSYSMNQSQINANIQLEYKAVFTSSKAESHTQWEQLGKNWSNSRLVRVVTAGGDPRFAMDHLNPSYGDNHNMMFSQWTDSIMAYPGIMRFILRPLSIVFSGSQATAVSNALDAYVNGAILVMADTAYTPGTAPGPGNVSTNFGIITNGNVAISSPPVEPPPPHVIKPGQAAPVGGYQLALYDQNTYAPFMVHTYYQTYLGGHTLKPNPDIYKAMMADIDAVTQRNYVAAVTGFGIDLQNYPSPEFQRWLLSVGANLEQWKKFRGYTDTGGSACYVVVGKQGTAPGHAIEMLQAVYSPSNWMQEPYLFNMNPSALALTYGRTAQKRAGTHSYGSLLPPAKAQPDPKPAKKH
ncbi:hypothetical protein NS506_03075 [Nocardia seriolae]|uniref:MACPF domain-containing protein n=1 Tax=Nocardia seriolae TaxID=37332 RepID=A0ABC8ASE0_9NOCA|nr:hypothetical protein NS506_03075 [Nocardia seriolae]